MLAVIKVWKVECFPLTSSVSCCSSNFSTQRKEGGLEHSFTAAILPSCQDVHGRFSPALSCLHSERCEKQPRILVIVLPLGKDSEMIGDDDCNYLNHLGATCQKNSWLAATPTWEWILNVENSYFLGISQTRQTIRVHELLCNYCLSGWWWSSTIVMSQTENKTSDERSYEGTQQTEDQTSARIHLRLCRMGNTHTQQCLCLYQMKL